MKKIIENWNWPFIAAQFKGGKPTIIGLMPIVSALILVANKYELPFLELASGGVLPLRVKIYLLYFGCFFLLASYVSFIWFCPSLFRRHCYYQTYVDECIRIADGIAVKSAIASLSTLISYRDKEKIPLDWAVERVLHGDVEISIDYLKQHGGHSYYSESCRPHAKFVLEALYDLESGRDTFKPMITTILFFISTAMLLVPFTEGLLLVIYSLFQ